MAYPAETVTLPADVFRYDPDLGIGAVDGGLDEGAEYTVSSRFVAPWSRSQQSSSLAVEIGVARETSSGLTRLPLGRHP